MRALGRRKGVAGRYRLADANLRTKNPVILHDFRDETITVLFDTAGFMALVAVQHPVAPCVAHYGTITGLAAAVWRTPNSLQSRLTKDRGRGINPHSAGPDSPTTRAPIVSLSASPIGQSIEEYVQRSQSPVASHYPARSSSLSFSRTSPSIPSPGEVDTFRSSISD